MTHELPFTGLTQEQAQELLRTEGFNELPTAKKRNIIAIAFDVLKEPMLLLLVSCGVIYLLVGDINEALVLLSFVFVVIGITLYQEQKAERALEALRDLSSPRALVIRDSKEHRIAGREVVREDIIVLSEGDRVPADAVVLKGTNLHADESLLTGESVPVRKNASDTSPHMTTMDRPGGDDTPFVFSGSLIVQGQGFARVVQTGARTEIGKIGKALQQLEPEKTRLQKETSKLIGTFAGAGIVICALVVVVFGLTRGSWLHGLLAGLTLAMAILPEEIPMILTIFLALGAWRISQKKVLTRRIPAIENLGSTTVLCVDKTGTLTMNRMAVRQLFVNGEFFDVDATSKKDLPEMFHELVEFSLLSSQKNPYDPMERAINTLGRFSLKETEHLHDNWDLVSQYPLSKAMLAVSHVWKSPEGTEYIIAAKGAPEAIGDLCHHDEAHTKKMTEAINAMASRGLRVLGVAKAFRNKNKDLPTEQHDFVFQCLGLIGLEDPVRPTVPQAIKECSSAGIRVVMITGDYPTTAKHIADQIGLKTSHIMTGPEIASLSVDELAQKVKDVNVFARVVPEQKLQLVQALKKNGEVVAMTGDGVNDAPALKAAHIGVAMGGRGTDVAREASALVVLDDDFSSIVAAVRTGRRIYDNIKKALAYTLAVHVPIAGMSLIPVLFQWPLMLLPVHIVFMELLIDPACSVVFENEPEEADIMDRKPRDPKEPLFGKKIVLISLLQGVSVLLFLLAIFVYFNIMRGFGEAETRALVFTTLIISNIMLIITNRSWTHSLRTIFKTGNKALLYMLIGGTAFLAAVLYVPALQALFQFATLHPNDIALCLAAGVGSIVWFEILKVANKWWKIY